MSKAFIPPALIGEGEKDFGLSFFLCYLSFSRVLRVGFYRSGSPLALTRDSASRPEENESNTREILLYH